jgi:hypothetical protein
MTSFLTDHQLNHYRKRREWHEREKPVNISGSVTDAGIEVSVETEELNTRLSLEYPTSIWKHYHENNKVKFLDNVTYIFTAHLPFLLKGNIRLNYYTGYPATYSWATHCFLRFLPAYWYMQKKRRGTKVFPLLKTLLNSRAFFAEASDIPPEFPETLEKNVVIPFTFGKDSFLSYHTAKELNLNPTLVYFNEPTELFSREHKLRLINQFEQITGEKVHFMDNPLGSLREYGEGWFGWELSLTSWTLLSLPFNYRYKAAYIVFSNEMDVNSFFYDEDGMKVIPDYEQSAQAMEELSLMTQSLTEGEVYTTTFLQGMNDLGIIAILKAKYPDPTFKLLMSCWAETEAAADKRWCADCSKCARMYVFMTANGIDPISEAGFKDNMFVEEKAPLYNVFGQRASGTGWDAFGLNTDQQALAFYLTYQRGNRDPLVKRFAASPLYKQTEARYEELIQEYYSLHPETTTPPQWKTRVDQLYSQALAEIRVKLFKLISSR